MKEYYYRMKRAGIWLSAGRREKRMPMDIYNEHELRLAVLIDAENISYSWIKPIMAEIPRYGTPTIKRIYTDWTQSAASGWKNVLLEYAITPIQQYRYTAGKNSSDSAMIIDAMDILYSEKVDGFCIVSSDSDFTRLAQRLREAGMRVIGLGVKKTPVPFKASCERFIYIENLKETPQEPPVSTGKAAAAPPAAAAAAVAPVAPAAPATAAPPDSTEEEATFGIDKLMKLLAVTISDVAEESGWASLSDVGSLLAKKVPDFDTRNYGFRTLTPLIESLGVFEIDKRKTSRPNIWHVYIKNKV
jgi:uncharacterized LabA/DUF88 family protein